MYVLSVYKDFRSLTLLSTVQIVDALIVLCAWLDEAHIFSGGIGKVFRLTRVLRPLRLIKKNKSLRSLMEVRFDRRPLSSF